MKIIFFSDIHLGIHGMADHCFSAMEVIVKYASDNNITQIGILGDLFHDRYAVPIQLMNRTIDFFEDVRNRGFEVFILPGNHDMPTKANWVNTAIKPLKHIMTVIDRVCAFEIYNRAFLAVPFLPHGEVFNKVLDEAVSRTSTESVLLTHIGCNGAINNTCFMHQMASVGIDSFRTFRTYTGHYHLQQELPNGVCFTGSILPFKFDEGGVAHGFYVLNTVDMTHEFIDIRKLMRYYLGDGGVPPDMLTVIPEQIDDLDDDDVCGNYFRIAHCDTISELKQREISGDMIAAGALSVVFLNLGSQTTIITAPGEKIINKLDMNALLDYWVANTTKPEWINMPLLHKFNRQIIQSSSAVEEND